LAKIDTRHQQCQLLSDQPPPAKGKHGLDRAPEVRTLRIELKHLADQEQAFSWSSTLCKEWMLEAPEEAAVLYVDGHVRVYHGTAKVVPSGMWLELLSA
jgi:hypothetical protein